MRKIIFISLIISFLTLPAVFSEDGKDAANDSKTQTEKVNAFLDKFIGKWQFEDTYVEEAVISTVEFQRVLEDKFIKGDLVSKSKENNEVVVKKTIYFNYNPTASKVLYFSLASDGWIFQYMGNYDAEMFKLQGVTQKGMDFFSWKFKSDDEIERAYFEPSTKFPDWSKPDKVTVLKKLK